MKNSGLMCRNLNVAHQRWIAPNAERIIRETAGANDLSVMRAPPKTSHLGACVDAVHSSTGRSVPEMDMTVVRSSTCRKNIWLPWAPAESLDSSLVVGFSELGDSQGASIPNGDKIIISASCKLSTVGAPLKTANLRRVRNQLSDLVLSNANIVVEDET